MSVRYNSAFACSASSRFFVLTLVVLLSWAHVACAQPAAAPSATPHLDRPQPPSIEAKAWLLLDLRSRQVIASHSADERVEPASLTKLMSAYLVFEALKQKQITLDQRLPVSQKAWRMPGSRMFLLPDATPTVDELLRGLIVVSGNDATIALAEGVAGSEEEFVARMNLQARRLGLSGTRFSNATGLPDPQHYSTTGDLARLAEAVARDFPMYLPLYALRSLTYNGITQPNRNVLLGRDPRVDGLKTGHTENAGYCLIATARSGDRQLLAVVMGAASESARALQAQKLLNYGFQYYQTVRLYAQGDTVAELPVWKGSAQPAQGRVRAGPVRLGAARPGRAAQGDLDEPAAAAGAGEPATAGRRPAPGLRRQARGRVSCGGAGERFGRQHLRAHLGRVAAAVQLTITAMFELPADVADSIVFLNGSFLRMDEARVPVLDRGFIFGDGVYEVIPVYARRPFRLQEHLRRLQYSLDQIRLANPYPDAGVVPAHPRADRTLPARRSERCTCR